MWIGCSDSKAPATEIVDMMPCEIFVHRNIGNLFVHTDINCLSVIQYAAEVLKVKHIIVCGHYGCAGIQTAFDNKDCGLIGNWLQHIKDVYRIHQVKIDTLVNKQEKIDLICELNVREQVSNIYHTTTVQNASESGQKLTVHDWVYDIKDGILKDINVCISGLDEMPNTHQIN